MILFDPDQPEAVSGFPRLKQAQAASKNGARRRSPLPGRVTLARYLQDAKEAVKLKGEVALLLTTDQGIRSLNRRYRNKNKATDVLSFPAAVDSFFGAGGHAGDLAISVETAAKQAESQGHSLSIELRVLMLHGLLHLAGYDHEADNGEMARKEARLRAKLGLPLGLIERTDIARPEKTRHSKSPATSGRSGKQPGTNATRSGRS
ncbi:rRNA maturation RNase YbeY [Acidicapsa dinghuensis]|uniref:Endoribonuclease YbeY n=1 Tax=Acidicapsa dinghuensis TaxID=2218256 RepID=A0ABW1ECS2_9BACT|nr:rRNA maturation RNase YbeY [Acidicapsa dinghuensis]